MGGVSLKAFCIYVSFRLNDTPDGLEVAVEDGAAVIYPFGTLGAEMERLPSAAGTRELKPKTKEKAHDYFKCA